MLPSVLVLILLLAPNAFAITRVQVAVTAFVRGFDLKELSIEIAGKHYRLPAREVVFKRRSGFKQKVTMSASTCHKYLKAPSLCSENVTLTTYKNALLVPAK